MNLYCEWKQGGIAGILALLAVFALSGLGLAEVTSVSNQTDVQSEVNETTLKLVQLLFCHGDRTPLKAYPHDPNQRSAWKQGWGQLTQTGIQQGFQLGHFLRKRYHTFLGENYQGEVYARSASDDISKMAANCVLAGLSKSDDVKTFDSSRDKQPITVHASVEQSNQLLSTGPCPKLVELKEQWRNSSVRWQQFKVKYKDLFSHLSKFTGETVNETNVDIIADTVFCEIQHNFRQPDWITSGGVQERLMAINDEVTEFVYPTNKTKQFGAGPLLHKIFDNIKLLPSERKEKLILYSGHDLNIIGVLGLLGLFDMHRPPYMACLMFELHLVDSLWFVKVLYRNDSTRPPFELLLPGCQKLCHLAHFGLLTSSMKMKAEYRAKECGNSNILSENYGSTKPADNVVPITMAVILPVLALLAYVAYKIQNHLRKRKTDAVTYRQLLENAEESYDESEDEF